MNCGERSAFEDYLSSGRLISVVVIRLRCVTIVFNFLENFQISVLYLYLD